MIRATANGVREQKKVEDHVTTIDLTDESPTTMATLGFDGDLAGPSSPRASTRPPTLSAFPTAISPRVGHHSRPQGSFPPAKRSSQLRRVFPDTALEGSSQAIGPSTPTRMARTYDAERSKLEEQLHRLRRTEDERALEL